MTNYSPWTSDEGADAVYMRLVERKTWIEIGAFLGRSKTACHREFCLIVPRDYQTKLPVRRLWSDEDATRAWRMKYEEKISYKEIAVLMGLTIGQVTSKIERMERPTKRLHFEPTAKFKVPPHCLEDRERRMMAPRDLTGEFFGDPPKGYSALERRA